MTRIIAVLSGKGGTGKTITALNLSVALGKMGYQVCAVDADLTMPNLSLIIGTEDATVTLHDVLSGEAELKDVLYSTAYENLYTIPAAIDWDHVVKADPRKLPTVVRRLAESFDFDFIIVDSPAGMQMDAVNAMLSASETILVTNPEISCITDTMKVGIVARKAGLKVLGFVLNRYGRSKNDIPPEAAEEVMEVKLLQVVPEDSAIREATLHGQPVVEYKPYSKGAKAFLALARKVVESGSARDS